MLLLAASLGACDRRTPSAQRSGLVPPPSVPTRYGLGRAASDSEIRVVNLDVNPAGVGLPEGSGTPAQGATIFAAKCASCHGDKGQGIPPAPRLVGRDPREGFPFALQEKAVKTIGNYWPYATTLYDYMRRTMPQTAPGSLLPDELYALTAFLLAQNEIVASDAAMSRTTLPQVRMPARSRFVPDDRRGGAGVR